MSNSKGSYHSTTENFMAAYDKLPASARAALANAAFQWAPQPWRADFEKRGLWKNGKEMAAAIAKLDSIEVGKEARKQARRKG